MVRSLVSVVSLALILSSILSCAPVQPIVYPPLTDKYRREIGTVGVVSLTQLPEGQLNVPIRGVGKGIGTGALGGAAGGVSIGMDGDPVAALFLPFFVAAGAIIGAISGGVTAVPESTARAIEAEISSALVSSQPQASVRRYLVQVAEKEGFRSFVGLSEIEKEADIAALSRTGINTVLEIAIFEVGLSGGRGSDPNLTLGVRARVRLVDTNNNAEILYHPGMTYSGPTKRFTVWGADEARIFREELRTAYHEMAVMIVDHFFLEVR